MVILKPGRRTADIPNEVRQEAVRARTVLMITLACDPDGARAPLKLGQSSHKKKVPIIANVSLE